MEDRKLAPKQQGVVDFIRAEIARGHDFPTQRAIADHMGWKNTTGAMDVMHLLSGLGFLTRVREGGRYRFGVALDHAPMPDVGW